MYQLNPLEPMKEFICVLCLEPVIMRAYPKPNTPHHWECLRDADERTMKAFDELLKRYEE